MYLYNPSFLWGFFFCLIPIFVHFFNVRKIRTIRFSNVQFLRTINLENSPRNRLKEHIILICRLLGIILIVIAFSNPRQVSKDAENGFGSLIVIDNSMSMEDRCGSIDCIEYAKRLASTLCDEMGPGHIYFSGLYSPKRYSGASDSKQLLDQLRVDKSQIGGFEDFEDGRILIISDFQKRATELVMQKSTDSLSMTLISVNRFTDKNVRVDSIFLENPFEIDESGVRLKVQLENTGDEPARNVLVRIFEGNNQLSSLARDIEGLESIDVEFELLYTRGGNYRIEIDDAGPSFDNLHFFNLPKRQKPRIVLVEGSVNKNLGQVYRNDEFFHLEVFSDNNVNFESVLSADLVILNDFKQLPNWLKNGQIKGDLVLVPGDEIDRESYRGFGIAVELSTDTTRRIFANSTLKHPFFGGIFSSGKEDASLPQAKALYSLNSEGDVLLKTNKDFLVRTNLNGLRTYWFNSPLTIDYTDLMNHSLFVPLMYRMAEDAISMNAPLSYVLNDEPIELKVNALDASPMYLVGEDATYIPETYLNNDVLLMEIPPELDNPGNYYLVQKEDTLAAIALNIEKSESEMDMKNSEELREMFAENPLVSVLDANNTDELEGSLEELRTGESYWKYALILALMFLLAETGLHRMK